MKLISSDEVCTTEGQAGCRGVSGTVHFNCHYGLFAYEMEKASYYDRFHA